MHRAWLITVVSILGLGIGLALAGIAVLKLDTPKKSGQPPLPMTQLIIKTNTGSTTLEVELATTGAQQEAGLSDRAGLKDGEGMLFVFDPPSTPGFWMKDMRFSLDIIFADAAGNIVTIYKNLSPETYPQQFYPTSPARYVLEVPAGFAQAHGLAVGQKIDMQ